MMASKTIVADQQRAVGNVFANDRLSGMPAQ
jgi:hypothetical protein